MLQAIPVDERLATVLTPAATHTEPLVGEPKKKKNTEWDILISNIPTFR